MQSLYYVLRICLIKSKIMVQSRNLFADQLRIRVVTLLERVYSQCTLTTGNHFQLPVLVHVYQYMEFKCLIQYQYLLNLIDEVNPTVGQTS